MGGFVIGLINQTKKTTGKVDRIQNKELIKEFEGLRLVAYLPTKDDVWTIGYGHTKGVKKGDVITKAQAEAFLEEDLAWVNNAIRRNVKVPLNQNQWDALGSWVYNLGETNLKKSTLLKRLNAGDYNGAADEFLKWVKQGNNTLPGLVRRRKLERALFLK